MHAGSSLSRTQKVTSEERYKKVGTSYCWISVSVCVVNLGTGLRHNVSGRGAITRNPTMAEATSSSRLPPDGSPGYIYRMATVTSDEHGWIPERKAHSPQAEVVKMMAGDG